MDRDKLTEILKKIVGNGCQSNNNDSVYYDDKKILSQLVEILENLVLVISETSEACVSALVYLICVGYKSNLISYELVQLDYNV